jgi:RNA polymerase sigma-70 factor (ECF subfamily)
LFGYAQTFQARRSEHRGENIEIPVPPQQDAHEDCKDVRMALELLPMRQREALLLVTVEDFSYKEAAEYCDVAVGTIKSRVSLARSALRQILQL